MDENRTPKREPNGGGGNNKKPKNRQSLFMFLMMCSIVMLAWTYFGEGGTNSSSKEITYTEFLDMVEDETISSVEIEGNQLNITPKAKISENTELTYYTYKLESNDRVVERLEEAGIKNVTGVTPDTTVSIIIELISIILPLAIIWIAMGFLMRRMGGGGVMGVGKSKAKVYIQKETGILFKDVAGQDEAKESLQEMVDFLHNPEKYTAIGAKLPKGALLVGPPGTGKTLLAKAVAGEAKVPFFSLSGSDFVEMFVGVGASRVRDLFEEAKKNAPCIVFIDEIDAVGRQRGAGLGGGNDEREQTLNQLLVEMDGFADNIGIIVIAATNRSDVLDPALLRAGRFDRQITVGLPDKVGREEILKVHARNKKIDETVNWAQVAKRTVGFSGADLASIINDAAILTVRLKKEKISIQEIDEAIDRRIAGPAKKSKHLTELERKTVAYHEAGHAIIGLLVPESDKVQKVTIVPRGMAGGYVLSTPEDDRFLMTKGELIARITGFLGGRSSEEIFFNDISTGASNDIEQATRIARAMVVEYGMSSLGPIQYESHSGSVFLGRDYTSSQKNFSGAVANEIDKEVRNIVETAHENAKKIILEHREDVELIAEALLEHETLNGEEIDYLLANRKMPEYRKKTPDYSKPVEEKEEKEEKKDSTFDPVVVFPEEIGENKEEE